MKPLVTIGVCVRNCECSIREALNSILNQDFPHERMEIIFVNDGSTDKTLPIILDFVSRIDINTKIFDNEWRGLGKVRNAVVDHAYGDYIVWVDGDMVLPKDHIRKQVEFMQHNPDVGIAKARHGTYSAENLTEFLENIPFQAVDFKYQGIVTSRSLGTGGSIYRVKAIRQVGGFDEQIVGSGEDLDVEYRIKEAGWLLYLGTPAFFYERRRKTWKDIWNHGFWYGYHVHYILRKDMGIIALYKMAPPAAFIAAVWYSILAYKIVRSNWVFLLPFQYTFKRIAWLFGFAKGQIDAHK